MRICVMYDFVDKPFLFISLIGIFVPLILLHFRVGNQYLSKGVPPERYLIQTVCTNKRASRTRVHTRNREECLNHYVAATFPHLLTCLCAHTYVCVCTGAWELVRTTLIRLAHDSTVRARHKTHASLHSPVVGAWRLLIHVVSPIARQWECFKSWDWRAQWSCESRASSFLTYMIHCANLQVR